MLFNIKHLQEKHCTIKLKKTFSLRCIFLCLGPHISVVTDARHPDPTTNWLPQLRWEWTTDTESLSDFGRCSCKPPSQGLPYSSPERPESLLFNWVALIIVWLRARGLFLFHGAKQEEMVRVLFTPLAEGTPYRTGQQHKTEPVCRHSPPGKSFALCCSGVLSWGCFLRWKGRLCTVNLLHIPGHRRETVFR